MTEAVLFGQRLRAVRKSHGVRLTDLAEKADTGVKHLGRIERGEKQPSFELIIALGKALNVAPSVFFDFPASGNEPRYLKLQLQQLLDGKNSDQLRRAVIVMRALFDPQTHHPSGRSGS